MITVLPSDILSPLQKIDDDLLKNQGISLFIKRDDLIHPTISGNKWRKLKYNIDAFQKSKKSNLLTFGGAFSNHLYATAAAGSIYNFKTIGIIRGEKNTPLSTTLAFAEKQGMTLHFVSRSAFQDKIALLQDLQNRFDDFYVLPEGGANALALQGCKEIVYEVHNQLTIRPDYWCVACGTGATFAGIIAASEPQQNILGFSALKINDWNNDIKNLFPKESLRENTEGGNFNTYKNWSINSDYHFGGYAKWQPELIHFMNNFKEKYAIQLDPIYTGKLFYGIFDLIKKGFFKQGSTIVAVHTGGLQGIEGFNTVKLKGKGLTIL